MLPRVFFDIVIDNKPVGKILFELYIDKTARTSENFRSLCTGERGDGKTGKPLHFKGSKFHRIMPEFMAQGGDITTENGEGGESIYDSGKFADEDFSLKHNERGDLSMANTGPNSNTSQFFITFTDCPHLNNKHVVFGKVVDGWNVLDAIEHVGSGNGTPLKTCIIHDCG